MATETETPRPKDSTSKMLDDQKRSEVPETSRELKKEQNNHSLEDIEWQERYFILKLNGIEA